MTFRKRIPELDSLRGIAAFAVMLYHFTVRFSDKFDSNIISKHFVFDYGKYGVELFFTISGFVIYMSLLNIKKPTDFVYKRFLRLYPTFWLCLIITYTVTSFWAPQTLKVSFYDFLINFTMLPSLFNSKSVDGVYWTLKVEMFFYATMLLLLYIKWLNKINLLGYLYLCFGALIFTITKIYPNQHTDTIINYYYYGLLFLCGINFYHITILDTKTSQTVQIFLAVLLSSFVGIDNMIVLLLVIGIFYLLIYNKLMFISVPPLLFLGNISYALYLIHQNIGYSIQYNMIKSGVENYIFLLSIPIAVSIILAWAISSFVTSLLSIKTSKLSSVLNK